MIIFYYFTNFLHDYINALMYCMNQNVLYVVEFSSYFKIRTILQYMRKYII